MTTHDTPEAALAAALKITMHSKADEGDARQVLAAMPDWTLVCNDDAVDGRSLLEDFGALDAKLDAAEAEIARLRQIEEAARLVSQWHGAIGSGPIEELDDELHLLYVLTHPSEP